MDMWFWGNYAVAILLTMLGLQQHLNRLVFNVKIEEESCENYQIGEWME